MKKINILLIALMLISTFTFSVPEVSACSYMYKTASERQAESDLVFRGTVTAFTQTKTYVDGQETDVHTITFKLNSYWKGSPTEYVTVTSSFATGYSCYPARATVGKDYVVFANGNKSKGYTVNEVQVQDALYLEKDFLDIGPGTPYVTGSYPSNSINECLIFTKELKLGSNGGDVSDLQTILLKKGFTISAIASGKTAKGYLGTQTVTALKKYQKSVGLPQTGKLDIATLRKINMSCISTKPVNSTTFSDLKVNDNYPVTLGSTYTISWNSKIIGKDPKKYYLYYIGDKVNGFIGEIDVKSNLYQWTVPLSIAEFKNSNLQVVISTQEDNVLQLIPAKDIYARGSLSFETTNTLLPEFKIVPSTVSDYTKVNQYYRQFIEVSGNKGTVLLGLSSGALPRGMPGVSIIKVSDNLFMLEGFPSATGFYAFTIKASDTSDMTKSVDLIGNITVTE